MLFCTNICVTIENIVEKEGTTMKIGIDRVSDPERVFNKINHEMPRPVGIIVVGADSKVKEKTKKQLSEGINNLHAGTMFGLRYGVLHKLFREQQNALIAMDSASSTNRHSRRKLVEACRCAGAKTVIIAFVSPHGSLEQEVSEEARQYLKTCPPTADEADYLLRFTDVKAHILCSGLSGNIGRALFRLVQQRDDLVITGGISRHSLSELYPFPNQNPFPGVEWHRFSDIPQDDFTKPDVIIDASHPDCFEHVLDLALNLNVPLISLTRGLSHHQLVQLLSATNHIPIFQDGNWTPLDPSVENPIFRMPNFLQEFLNNPQGSLFRPQIIQGENKSTLFDILNIAALLPSMPVQPYNLYRFDSF